MLLAEDVEGDLIEWLPEYYKRNDDLLVYQNGKDNPRYAVVVKVYPL